MDTWQAVAEPSRRRILLLLAAQDLTAGQISENFSSSRSAVSQHLAVLRATGLVTVAADGRRRIYRLERHAMAALRHDIEAFWTDELDRLSSQARSLSHQQRSSHDTRETG